MSTRYFGMAMVAALMLAGCGGGGGGANAGPAPAPSPAPAPAPAPSPSPGSPSVTAVSATTSDFSAAASPRMNELAYYRVTGSNLPATLSLTVADCARMTSLSSSSTEARFRCMPSFTEGAKAITVAASAADAALFTGSVTVKAATAPLPMPTYGFNLGNTFEATWGYPEPGPAVYTSAAQAGFNAVRIPCAWDFNSDKATGKINADYLAKVKLAVDRSLAAGMHVLINIHWDGGWMENHIGSTVDPTIDAKLKSYWTQIATAFADYDKRLLFAAANEPNVHNPAEFKTLMAYYQTFINAVRAAGGKNTSRWLVLQGGGETAWFTTLPADPTPGRLMVEYHNYTPSLFTIIHSDQSWGKAIYYWGEAYHFAADASRNAGSWGEEGYIDSGYQQLKEMYVDKGIPVLIGELQAAPTPGLTGDSKTWNKASTLYWNKYAVDSAQAHGLSPFYWSTPNSPFDYGTGTILDQPVVTVLTGGAAPPPPNGAPEAVTGLVATANGSKQVDLSWNAISGANSYRLYRSAQSGYQPAIASVSNIAGTSYSDTGLNDGTTYHYKVVAVNASGISGYSTEVHASTPGSNPDPSRFHFETDTQRWTYSGDQITGIATSTVQKFAGQRSLAVSINAKAAGSSSLDLSGAIVPAGATISFHVWVPSGHAISSIESFLQDNGWGWTSAAGVSPTANGWTTVSIKLPSNAVSPLQRLSLKFNTSAAWTGTVYVDSIDWTTP